MLLSCSAATHPDPFFSPYPLLPASPIAPLPLTGPSVAGISSPPHARSHRGLGPVRVSSALLTALQERKKLQYISVEYLKPSSAAPPDLMERRDTEHALNLHHTEANAAMAMALSSHRAVILAALPLVARDRRSCTWSGWTWTQSSSGSERFFCTNRHACRC
jgi:hypothetical protein